MREGVKWYITLIPVNGDTGGVRMGHEILQPMKKFYFIYHPIREGVKA